jgi:general secretion pathway protein D
VNAPNAAVPGPGAAGPAGAGTEQLTAVVPSGGGTNQTGEQPILPGMINFNQADLPQVLQIYAELKNRTILRPTVLPAQTITLRTQTALSRQEAIQALDAVLGLNGIAMVDIADKFVKAVPMAQAGTVGAPFGKGPADQLNEMGQYVTHVVQLTYVRPSEMVQALTPFATVGMQNGILPIETSQILVLRDYTENVKRMLEMVKKIDVAVPAEFISEVIPIKYAKAAEIASALNSLSSGGGGASIGASTGGGTRGGVGSGFGNRMGGTGGMGGTGSYGNRGAYGSGYPGSTFPGGVNQMGVNQPQAGAGAAGTFGDRLRNIIQKASASGEITVLGQTKMIADERTNSLLIFASREDMKTIKEVVAKLDVVLAQVLIEAVIIEVALGDNLQFGVSYLQKSPTQIGNFNGIGALNNGNMLSADKFLSGGSNGVANLPGGFSYLAQFGNDLDVTVTALAENNRGRILQRPRIQTSHNEPASLFVGETVPYPTASYYGGGAYGGYSSIQQVPIGVTLTVTPLINPDGLVVMDINTDIQNQKGEVIIANVGTVPITSQKTAGARVSVRDRDTIMLGGLIATTKTKAVSGIPLLKDIPVLGWLFRSTSDKEQRGEMIVLIRPTVLPTPEVAALAATAEQNKMPLVKQANKENQDEVSKRLKAVDKKIQEGAY